jgi:phosphoribosylanthranilate isomerase
MTRNIARTRIKMCGITRPEDLHNAVATGADAVGFVMYDKSPRAVSLAQAAELAALLPPFVTPVLLFVNPNTEQVHQAIARVPHALLQFHGDESADFCASFARPYIRAVRISQETTSTQLAALLNDPQHRKASALLLDSFSPHYGGSGAPFDWSILPAFTGYHMILSGGLHAGNVWQGISMVAPRCLSLAVDVSSGIETSKGVKDLGKMRAFAKAVYATQT